MRIRVRVKAHARKNEVKQLDVNQFLISVTAPPVEGKANEKVIELLAEYFDRPKRCITIFRGNASKDKIVEVE
jgi:uncharacterized protein (TIGR00251 family)